MISTPTTFVVGAGASKDYGLPTSAELRQEAHNLSSRHTAYQLILAAELCTPVQLNTVLDDLRKHGTDSIDEYICDRQGNKLAMEVGRALIALLLGSKISAIDHPDSLGAKDLDWLGYIIKMMRPDAPNCEEFVVRNAEVRFVTFSFDSIIEDRLEKAIRNLYRGAAEPRLQAAVSAVHDQVIHVHGRLPRPPDHPLPRHEFTAGHSWLDWLQSAQSKIRVVMDQIEPEILDASQEAVKRSKILCFLGFAYARDNLSKLGLPEVIHVGADGQWVNRNIFGTTFRMGKGEIASVNDKLAGAELGDGTERCLGFLRDHYIFRG